MGWPDAAVAAPGSDAARLFVARVCMYRCVTRDPWRVGGWALAANDSHSAQHGCENEGCGRALCHFVASSNLSTWYVLVFFLFLLISCDCFVGIYVLTDEQIKIPSGTDGIHMYFYLLLVPQMKLCTKAG